MAWALLERQETDRALRSGALYERSRWRENLF